MLMPSGQKIKKMHHSIVIKALRANRVAPPERCACCSSKPGTGGIIVGNGSPHANPGEDDRCGLC